MFTLDQILTATTFTELFPNGTKKEYRMLLKQTHPDMHPGAADKAQKAFVHVNYIWTHKPTATQPEGTKPQPPSNTISTKKHEYFITRTETPVNNIITYQTVYDSISKATIYLANHPKVSELLLSGTKNLKTIKTSIPEMYHEYFPETIDVFRLNTNGTKLAGTVHEDLSEYYTLREVINAYPKGVDGKDLAWMYRRMLVAVGNTHDAGYTHNAPTLDSFILHPETHLVKLINWQFSTPAGTKPPMTTSETKPILGDPPESSVKNDITITAATASKLVNPKLTHPRIVKHLNAIQKYPTGTAKEALREFDELIYELWGPRKFHRFTMPPKS